MAKPVGIDLGTTNSVAAVWEQGKATVIQNAEGSRTTPSVVAFTKDGDRLVGQIAKRQAVINPENTVYSAKRFIGRKFDEVDEESKIVSYRVLEGKDKAVRFDIRGKQYAPEEISAQVLKKLVEDASKHLGEKVKDVVIAVPAYFNDSQRQATKDAGVIAGLNVLRIINEPTAASLSYGLEKKESETVLVFDFGGGTFDVSILEVGEGVVEVKATNGDTHLGGDDLDKRIVDWMASDFKNNYGIDLRKDHQALQRLYEAAERAKCELSSMVETTINLPFVTADASGPKHLDMQFTRAKFEELTSDLLQRLEAPFKQALSDAKITADDIDEVVLVGGSTRIPAVHSLVKRLSGGRDPNQTVNPDEVVAVGAAIQAGVLSGEVEDVVLLDVTPLSLGVETLGGVMTKIIERNTTIPVRRSQVFSTAEDNQPAVDIQVLQGEREMARDNRTLGNFKLEGIPPAPRGMPQISVTFDTDANGILNVSAQDKATGKEQTIAITGSTSLNQEEIDRMVRDAEAHANEDKAKKQKAEARNQADSLAYQVEKQLSDLGSKVPAHDKARCEHLISDVRQALNEDADTAKLQSLTSDLQQAAYGLSSAVYQGTPGGQGGGQEEEGQGSGPGRDEDVVDAEYTEQG